MPLKLARFLVEFLTKPDDLVVDLFAGWNTVGLAAEQTGRRWLALERLAQYAAGAALRFREADGFLSSVDIELPTVGGVARFWPEHPMATKQ
jgi:DNA modification methylase